MIIAVTRSVGLLVTLSVAIAAACGGKADPIADARPPAAGDTAVGVPAVAPTPMVWGVPVGDVLSATIANHGSDAWYGAYLMGAKAGHGRMTVRASRPDEPGAIAFITTTTMTMKNAAGAQTIEADEARFYRGEPPYRLAESRFRLSASGAEDVRRLIVQPDGAGEIVRTVGGETTRRDVGPVPETVVASLLTLPPTKGAPAVGAKASAPSWDWMNEKVERLEVTVTGREFLRRVGVDTEVTVLSVHHAGLGMTMTWRVADIVLEMSSGPGISMRLEDEVVAKSGQTALDVMGSSVKVAVALGSPKERKQLTLLAKTSNGVTVPSSARQTVVQQDDGRVKITLTRGPSGPVTEAERAAALGEDAMIDTRSPAIQARAKALVEGHETARERANAIAGWVYRTLDKRLATHLPTASLILERKVGDCTEHAALFTALARAAGIPARIVYGLAYTGDRDRAFAYHAWVEVALDGQWWPLDPTWDEEDADATHLALGDGPAAIANFLGGLELTVVNAPEQLPANE